ncbi:MAG: multidrug transporter MATE, partial [Atopobium sp.]|nr:multidrug transporter MATE [Atopobium sp.]
RSTSIAFISAILGTVLEYYFLGVLGLSVEYAALGYCISITFSSLYGVWPFIGNKQILKFVKPHFNWTHIKEIFVNGFPIFMQNISSRIYSLLMNAALLTLGGDIAIASYGVLLYSGGLIQPLIYGQADAMQPAIGYNWGAKKKDRVLAIEKYIFSTGIIIGIFAFCVSFFFSEFLVKLYLPEGTQELLNMAIPAMRIHAFIFIFSWITMCTESLAIALKQTKISNLLSVFMALIFPISSLMVLRPFGLDALWYVSVVSNILSALLSVGCLIHIYRKHFRGVGADDADNASELQNENAQLTEAELAEAELAASELSSPEDHLDGESISRAQ